MGLGSKGTMWECVSYTIMNLLYDWVLNGAIFIAGLAGELFNTSIQFSLTGKVFDADKNTMIKDGWTLVRDLLNLVFIFILLFAPYPLFCNTAIWILKNSAKSYCRRLIGQL